MRRDGREERRLPDPRVAEFPLVPRLAPQDHEDAHEDLRTGMREGRREANESGVNLRGRRCN